MRTTMLLIVALALPVSAAEDFAKYMVPRDKDSAGIYSVYATAVYGMVRSTERLGDGQRDALAEKVGMTERDATRVIEFGEHYGRMIEQRAESANKMRAGFCKTFKRSGEIDVVALQDQNAKDAKERGERDRKLYDRLIGDLSDEGRESVEELMSRLRMQRKSTEVDWVAYARDFPEQTNEYLAERCKDA